MASSEPVITPASTDNSAAPRFSLHEHLRSAAKKLGRELSAQELDLEYNVWALHNDLDYPEFDDD